jgi:hypothetical protein
MLKVTKRSLITLSLMSLKNTEKEMKLNKKKKKSSFNKKMKSFKSLLKEEWKKIILPWMTSKKRKISKPKTNM